MRSEGDGTHISLTGYGMCIQQKLQSHSRIYIHSLFHSLKFALGYIICTYTYTAVLNSCKYGSWIVKIMLKSFIYIQTYNTITFSNSHSW